MREQFLRTEMILGSEAVERLRSSHVAVFGLGGVGSYAVEACCDSWGHKESDMTERLI